MNYYRQLYVKSGYLWTCQLEDFVQEYAGTRMKYPHPITKNKVEVRFCAIDLIQVSRSHGQHVTTSRFLNDDLAPVGDCSDGNIELLLAPSGRLIGFADYMLLSWAVSDKLPNWRESVCRLLAGEDPSVTAVISDPSRQQDPW